MAPHVAARLAEIRECVENDGGQLLLVAVCQNTRSALVLILPADEDMEPMTMVIDSIRSFDVPEAVH